MLTTTCHCGAVRITIPRRPRSVTACNCSICRRYGVLWAYYKAAEVQVTAAEGAQSEYRCADKVLRFGRCSHCGCVTHWEHLTPTATSNMGVNMRNFDPEVLGPVRIRLLDGADTWKYVG